MTQGNPFFTGLAGAALGIMGLTLTLLILLSGFLMWRKRRRHHKESVLPMQAYDLEEYNQNPEQPDKK
ncbi:hypothetical protein ColTof3_14342 [Colletotrichum tofieldiae]|nr:hypothetical protein ColTof3_14342 [Colletotrichum tofieldiae]